MLWDIATTGHTIMPDGSTLLLAPEDWVGLVKWIYQHIDGPPKAELDVTSDGNPLIPINTVLVHAPVEGESE